MSEKPKQDIMEATFTALCKHGYADLSIQKIADEFDKGKSLIYYHFDDKEELMLAFLDYMGERVEETHEELEELEPDERLDKLLDMALGMTEEEQWEFQKAFLELRAQAPRSPGFADKFEQIDSIILEYMENTLEELNVENPGLIADMLISCIEGSVIRKVSIDDKKGLENLKNSIKGIVEQSIVEGCQDC